MKISRNVLACVVSLPLALAAVAGFLVGTTVGLNLLFTGVSHFVPGLSIKRVEGSWSDLNLKGVSYQMPGVNTVVGHLHLALKPACLIRSAICVSELSVSDASVAVDTTKIASSGPSSEQPAQIRTPYPIILSRLSLHNIDINVHGTAVSLSDFTSGAHWRGRSLVLMPTHINNLKIAVTKAAGAAQSSNCQKKASGGVAEQLNTLFAKPLLPKLPNYQLPLDIDIQQIVAEQLHIAGASGMDINRLEIQAHARGNDVKLTTLSVVAPQGEFHASGGVLMAQQWPVNLIADGTINNAPLKDEKVGIALTGVLSEQLHLALNLSGPINAQLAAQTELTSAGLPLMLRVTSKQLNWPPTEQSEYQLRDVNLELNGKATDYTLALNGSLNGEKLPPITVTLNGTGDAGQFSLDKLHLALLQGSADLTGKVDWDQSVSWNSEMMLYNLNTQRQYPQWPAKLTGTIRTSGSFCDGAWQLNVPELILTGSVKQSALSVRGKLYGDSTNQWQVPGLDLTLGRNHLAVKGTLQQKLALDAIIDAPHLENLLFPGLEGSVEGAIQIRGNSHHPQLLTDVTARNLRWQMMRIAKATLKGDITSGDNIHGKLAFRVNQLIQDTVKVDSLNLDIKGSEQQHQLEMTINGEPVAGQLKLNGRFNRQQQQWLATLSETHFNTPMGFWQPTNNVALDYRHLQQSISIGPHCWRSLNGELCVPQSITLGPSGHIQLVLNKLNLLMLKPLLPNDVILSGFFDGDANIHWNGHGALPEGYITLTGNEVKIAQRTQENTPPVMFDHLDFNTRIDASHAQLDWLIKIANKGQLNSRVEISDLENKRKLSGNIDASRLSLAILNPVLTQQMSVKGLLNSQLRLDGNLRHPMIYGDLSLRYFNLEGGSMPVSLTSADLTMLFNGMNSTLDGFLQTTQGKLSLSGRASWRELNDWRASIIARGDRIRVAIPPMADVDLSPDLTLEATPKELNLNGRVVIPSGHITIQDMPESVIRVSADEVMLDKNLHPIAPKSAVTAINSNLTIHLGDDVSLNAFGLDAKLGGDLKVGQNKRGLTLNGQINIPEGRFHAYGQDLLVRRGVLQFSGSPELPWINIEAIRNPEATEDDVIAGLRVTGKTDAPLVEVFSDPAMSQEEALSYLLRGQKLESGSEGDSAVTSALIGLGIASSGQIVGKIGEFFGVSNLTLDTAGVGEKQQVEVSGYVSPRLQVKYGVGIFDSLATLTLRYRLMPRLYLEAISGLDQALSLLYQFTF